MADEQFRAFQKVSCLCGAQIRVDPLSQDRRVTCPSCQNTFDFVVTMDPRLKNSRVSMVLSRGAMKAASESIVKKPENPPPAKAVTRAVKAPENPPPAKAVTRAPKRSPGKTIRVLMGQCECGATFPLEDTGELASVQSCPQCNRSYHVVFKLESGTRQKSAILVPDKPIVQRSEKARTIAPSKPPRGATQMGKTVMPGGADSRVTDFFTPAKKGRTRVTKARPNPLPEIPPGAQGVPCSCGEIFVVRRKDLAEEMTCGNCGRPARFEEVRDPQTLAPVIRIRSEA